MPCIKEIRDLIEDNESEACNAIIDPDTLMQIYLLANASNIGLLRTKKSNGIKDG